MEIQDLMWAKYRNEISQIITDNRCPHYELLRKVRPMLVTKDWQNFWEDITLTINNQFNEENND